MNFELAVEQLSPHALATKWQYFYVLVLGIIY